MVGSDVGLCERGPKKELRGSVVGRGIKCSHAEIEGSRDDGVGGEGSDVFVVLVVEGCGTAD